MNISLCIDGKKKTLFFYANRLFEFFFIILICIHILVILVDWLENYCDIISETDLK